MSTGIGKDFKVKDSINVGLSGFFDAGIKIGAFPYTGIENNGPAIDAWGPILSGGRDLSTVIGDSVADLAEGTEQSYIQFVRQEEQTFENENPSKPWPNSVNVAGLGTWDSPTFAGIALSGTSGTAVISGAGTLILDPGGYGNNDLGPGGVVRVKGDLYVDGTTTTINSSTISLSDTVITLGQNATATTPTPISSSAALPAGGAGIEIGSISGATILYHTAGEADEWLIGAGTNINGSLSANGGLTIDDAATLKSTLGVTSNATIGGTLGVTGAATLDSSLHVAGNTTIDGNTTLSGNFAIHAEGDQDDVQFSVAQGTGNTTVGGTLNVAGATDIDNTLDVTGATTLDSTLAVAGTTTLSDDLTATGEAHFTSTVTVSGDVVVKDSGTDTTKLTIANDTGTVTTYGSVSAQSDLHVDGNTTLANATVEDLDADKVVKATTGGRLTESIITDDGSKATVTGSLSATNVATLDNGLTAKGEVSLEGVNGSTKAFTYAGTTGATTSDSLIETLSVTDCNAAKLIVSVENGATGKTVIEIIAAIDNSGDVYGTAYGQVDAGTAPLSDIDITKSNGKIAVGVKGVSAGIAVVVFATGFYN